MTSPLFRQQRYAMALFWLLMGLCVVLAVATIKLAVNEIGQPSVGVAHGGDVYLDGTGGFRREFVIDAGVQGLAADHEHLPGTAAAARIACSNSFRFMTSGAPSRRTRDRRPPVRQRRVRPRTG